MPDEPPTASVPAGSAGSRRNTTDQAEQCADRYKKPGTLNENPVFGEYVSGGPIAARPKHSHEQTEQRREHRDSTEGERWPNEVEENEEVYTPHAHYQKPHAPSSP